jgi:hypothetical protein
MVQDIAEMARTVAARSMKEVHDGS